jgi:putrescine aminotransferase
MVHVPYGDLPSIANAVTENTAAVLIETVQHEAGVFVAPEGYLEGIRDLCDERRLLLILDEIKTGMGKTGRFFSCEHASVVPDVLVLGKSLGAGLIPIGAVLANRRIWRAFGLSFSMSASSYAGNVLACRVGCETIRTLDENLLRSCREKGKYILDGLKRCAERHTTIVRSVSGQGLLAGVELADNQVARAVARQMIGEGVLVFTAFGNGSVLMIEPPIIITDEQATRIVQTFESACDDLDR